MRRRYLRPLGIESRVHPQEQRHTPSLPQPAQRYVEHLVYVVLVRVSRPHGAGVAVRRSRVPHSAGKFATYYRKEQAFGVVLDQYALRNPAIDPRGDAAVVGRVIDVVRAALKDLFPAIVLN